MLLIVHVYKFIGLVASVLRGRVAGAEYVYMNVVKTKFLPILSYGIDCLRLDRILMSRSMLFNWNTAFYMDTIGVSRYAHMRIYFEAERVMELCLLHF